MLRYFWLGFVVVVLVGCDEQPSFESVPTAVIENRIEVLEQSRYRVKVAKLIYDGDQHLVVFEKATSENGKKAALRKAYQSYRSGFQLYREKIEPYIEKFDRQGMYGVDELVLTLCNKLIKVRQLAGSWDL